MAFVLGFVVYIRILERILWIYGVHRKFIDGAQKVARRFIEGSWFYRILR